MPPAYVKPYVKRQKNDAADAEAICEAVTRVNMRFVATKTPEQQSCLMLHRTRHLFIRQQTSVINATDWVSLLPNSISASSPPPGVVPDFSPTYTVSGDGLGPRPSHQPAPLGIHHSRRCGSVLGSPSRANGPATPPSIVPIDVPQCLWISPRAPRASMPIASDTEELGECHRVAPPDYKSMMTAYQKPAQSP
jgi:hypothetical protein